MQVTLEINSDSASSILEVLKQIKGVTITSVETVVQPKEEILKGIQQAVVEVRLARAGKKKLKTFDELLSEL